MRPRHPTVAVHEHENAGEGEHTEHDGRDPLHRMGIVRRLLLVDAEQRDHEEEQHDDRARVHDDLDRGDERRVLLEVQDGDADQREQQEQRRVHRVAARDDAERADDHGGGTDEKYDGFH